MKLDCGVSKSVKFVGFGPSASMPKRKSFVAMPDIFSRANVNFEIEVGKECDLTCDYLVIQSKTSTIWQSKSHSVISILRISSVVEIGLQAQLLKIYWYPA